MLAQAAMPVVFVLGEKISRGTHFMSYGGFNAKVFDYASKSLRCHSDDTD